MTPRLPLPRSRRARLLAGAAVLAGAGGLAAVVLLTGGVSPSGTTHGPTPGTTAEGADEGAGASTHPRFVLSVDAPSLPEVPVPADAPVVHPEGPSGLLSRDQLAALSGASLVRDGEGRLRVVSGDDRRADATTADRVRALPGVLSVEPAGEAFLVETDLPGEQLRGLPGVAAVTHEDGSPLADVGEGTAPTGDPGHAEEAAADAGGH